MTIEGIGEAVTGGMIARTVEPSAGEVGQGKSETCLNCGTALVGAYCHNCGQPEHIHRTIGAFFHDLLHGVLHFEGKTWRTLPLLAWKPGELTRRYIAGERARFVSPMAMFLFSVFLMFATFSLLGGPFPASSHTKDRAEEISDYRRTLRSQERELRALVIKRDVASKAGQSTAEIDESIRELRGEIADERTRFRRAMGRIDAAERRTGQFTEPFEKAPIPGDREPAIEGVQTGIGWIDSTINKASQNPKLLFYKLQSNAYKFSWALIPISVPFVWMMFLHRRRYRKYRGFDHTVFVTYSIAFMSLGLVALTLVRPLGLGKDFAELAMLIVPPIHMYRQLRGAYSLSRWSAGWRTFTLIIFAFIAGSLFFSLLLTGGLLG